MPEQSVFHIFNKSIAGYTIFNTQNDYARFIWILRYFLLPHREQTFSNFLRCNGDSAFEKIIALSKRATCSNTKVISYCLMPTHFHLLLYQETPTDISTLMHNVQSSYAQFFNLKHIRKGPLWQGRFQHVHCKTDDQLLHLTRYIHLNPVTAHLTEMPEDWLASSYDEYVKGTRDGLCKFKEFVNITPKNYADFVTNRIHDQRMLAEIKTLMLDNEPISLPGSTSRK